MKSWMKELTSGLDAFLHAVPPGTKVQILCFNDDVKLLESISNPSELVNKLEFKGGSLLYDAVAAAVGQATHDQEALLLITDGSDTGSAIVSSVALQKVEATDIPCYTIGIAAPPTGSKDSGNAIDKAFLEDLAKISGAAFVMKDPRKADKNPDLATVLKQIAAEMAATDSIQLVNGSAIAPGWHQIEIDVTRGGVKVHCKKQVFYGAK